MSINLWSFYDSKSIENIVTVNKLNTVKVVLLPFDEGYQVMMKINGEEESMSFTYENTTILDAIDYGVIPTTIFSGICQAKEDYIYQDYVVVEIIDRRSQYEYIETMCDIMNSADENERRTFTTLRLSDNTLVKLTGIQSRTGDVTEEQHIIASRMSTLNLDKDNNLRSVKNVEDPYDFIDSHWFQRNTRRYHMSRIYRLKKSLNWKDSIDGHFRPDIDDNLHKTKNKRLKHQLKRELFINKSILKKSLFGDRDRKIEIGANYNEMENILNLQKQTIFNLSPVPSSQQYDHCHEECVHKMMIRSSSPQSGCHFRVSVHRCALHNRHWGLLTVDQWQGCSSGPMRFQLPGGHEQARRLLAQLSDMLHARQMSPPPPPNTTNTSTLTPTLTVSTTPFNRANSVGVMPTNVSNSSAGWFSMENIQSNKLIYDNIPLISPIISSNNPNVVLENNPKKFSNNPSTIDIKGMMLNRSDSNTSINGLGYSGISSNEALSSSLSLTDNSQSNPRCSFFNIDDNSLQQKPSLFSLKDLNLDDLF